MKTSKLLFLCLLFLSAKIVSAQVDQKTALFALGDGSLFKSYWGVKVNGTKTSGQADKRKYELKLEKSVPHRDYAFKMMKEGTNSEKINSGFGWLEPNHHTKASAFIYKRDKGVYIYLNGLLYYLENAPDPNNIKSIEIDEIYVLWKPANPTTDLNGKTAAKAMKKRDHVAVLTKYLADMKVIQEKATANFTDKEKDEVVMIAQAKKDRKAGIQAKNAAYWNSPEGQRVLAKSRKPKVTLVNDTGGMLLMCYGQGVSDELEPGEKKEFSCSTSVYRGTRRPNNNSQYDRTSNELLTGDGNNCGAVINASTVIQ